MLTLLLGADEFGKKEYIDALAARENAEVVVFAQPEFLPMGELTGQDLFAANKVFVLRQAIKLFDGALIGQLMAAKNQIILTEDALDKRLTINKNLLANKAITVKDFQSPHGKELDRWIQRRVQVLGGTISSKAVEVLAVSVGRDAARETKFGGKVVSTQEIFSLLDVDNEIKKLLAFAAGAEITEDMVRQLVPQRSGADVLDIVNAIGENNRQRAFGLMKIFLVMENASDEKGKIIQLNALLSEQFRNIAVVQDFSNRGVGEPEILSKTGWKPGRLFIMKKLSSKLPHKTVLGLLTKLSHLDEELKTTSTPPRVLLDLIFSQL